MQAEPTRALNIPVIPVGPLMATVHPLASYPPYVLSWLNSQISAQDMMDQKLFEKLVLNNFGKFQFFLRLHFVQTTECLSTKYLCTFLAKKLLMKLYIVGHQGLPLRNTSLYVSSKIN